MILIKLADYVTDLMGFDTTKVIVGRSNATQETFTQDYIVVDILSPSQIVSTGRDYDSDTEKEDLRSVISGKFTLEFYGSNGYDNINKFMNLQNSQSGKDIQKTYAITTYKSSTINTLPQQVGNKYFDRYEIEIMVQYNSSLEIDTLRIGEIPVEYSQT